MTWRGTRRGIYDVFPDNTSTWERWYALRQEAYEGDQNLPGDYVDMGVGDTLVLMQGMYYAPPGELAGAFLYFSIAGSATFNITYDWNIGYGEGYSGDQGPDDWYYAMPSDRAITPFGALSVNSTKDRAGLKKYWIPVPDFQDTTDRGYNYDGLLIRITCTSGSALLDYQAYQEEAVDGYHYQYGTHFVDEWQEGPVILRQIPPNHGGGQFGPGVIQAFKYEDNGFGPVSPYDYGVMCDLTAEAEAAGGPWSNSMDGLSVGETTYYWAWGGGFPDNGGHHTEHRIWLKYANWPMSLTPLSGSSDSSGNPPPSEWWGGAIDEEHPWSGWNNIAWPSWYLDSVPPLGRYFDERWQHGLNTLISDPEAINPIQWQPDTAAIPLVETGIYYTMYEELGDDGAGGAMRAYELDPSLENTTENHHSQYVYAIKTLPADIGTSFDIPSRIWSSPTGHGAVGAAHDDDMAGITPNIAGYAGGRWSHRGGTFTAYMRPGDTEYVGGGWMYIQFPPWRYSVPTWIDGSAQFGMPPLRQRHRTDGLTTDTRQERGHGDSLQSSTRRGPRTYY